MRLVLLFLLISTSLCAINPPKSGTLKLKGDYKIVGTFSGDIQKKESFHIIIARNNTKKQYEIIPLNYSDDKLIQLPSISYKKQPSIVSYHTIDNGISIIASFKKKKDEFIQVIDVDIETGKHKMSKEFSAEDFKTVIRESNKNYLLFAGKSNNLIIKTVNNSESISEAKVLYTEENDAVLRDFSDESIDAINTSEYVENGSIGDIKAYVIKDAIIITKKDFKAKTMATLKIPISSQGEIKVASKSYDYSDFEGVKKASSYVSNTKLYQLLLNKKELKFKIIQLDADKETILQLTDKSISNASDGFTGLEAFLKQAGKSGNEPTITVNSSKDGNAVVKMDYVSKKLYRYNYNWWWHHHFIWQQQMMWQQQQMMNNISVPTGFGPSMYREDFYFKTKKKHHFEIVIGNKNQILPEGNVETEFVKIDRKKHVKALNEKRGIMHESSVFLGTTFRVFEYDKKAKVFKVTETIVND